MPSQESFVHSTQFSITISPLPDFYLCRCLCSMSSFSSIALAPCEFISNLQSKCSLRLHHAVQLHATTPACVEALLLITLRDEAAYLGLSELSLFHFSSSTQSWSLSRHQCMIQRKTICFLILNNLRVYSFLISHRIPSIKLY